MPSIFDGFLKQAVTGDTIKDYKHASRLFVDNNYERSPKYAWLFHVFFDLNPEFTQLDSRQQIEAGMLVKSAELPRFRVDSKVYNNYNRPSIAQTKTRFEDINITFYDDSANIVRKLWFDYYNFYYRDMDNNYGDATGAINDVYKRSNKQVLGQRDLYNQFGYTPRKVSSISNQYINAIRIYSLHQKKFSEYTLINPIISMYRHGTHATNQEGTMENVMTISYESVLYAGGSAKVARGFADLHYDKSPSPLTVAGGGTNSLLGPGGIVNVLDEVIVDGSNGKWGSSAFKLLRGYQKNKNVDLMNLARGELVQSFQNILRSGESSGTFDFGTAKNATYIPYRGINVVQGTGFQSALATQTIAAPGSVNSNGFNITAGASAITGGIANALNVAGNPLAGATSQISGLVTNTLGKVTGGDINKVIDLAKDQGNQLLAQASQEIPQNSFTAGIQLANDYKRALASSDLAKTLQEGVGKTEAFFNSSDIQNTVATFRNKTNDLVNQVGAFAKTPFSKFQFSASDQVANNLTSNYFKAPSAADYEGNTSTNPTQSA